MENTSVHVSMVPQLKKYNWPSDGSDTWRHITEYFLYDEDEQTTDLLLQDGTRSVAMLKGVLLPPPDSSCNKIRVHFTADNYAIDFGTSVNDPNRGFWILGEDEAWYKLDGAAHASYQDTAQKALRLCDEYIKFYDAIVYGVGSGKELAEFNERSSKFTCRLSVDEVHEASGGAFDLSVVAREADFFFERATTSFAITCPLMRSLRAYTLKSQDRSKATAAAANEESVIVGKSSSSSNCSSSSSSSPPNKKVRHISKRPTAGDAPAPPTVKTNKPTSLIPKRPPAARSAVPTPPLRSVPASLKALGRAPPKRIPIPQSILNHDLLSGVATTSSASSGIYDTGKTPSTAKYRASSTTAASTAVNVIPQADWLAVAEEIHTKRTLSKVASASGEIKHTPTCGASASSSDNSNVPAAPAPFVWPSDRMSSSCDNSNVLAAPAPFVWPSDRVSSSCESPFSPPAVSGIPPSSATMSREEMLAYITKLSSAKMQQPAVQSSRQPISSPASDPRLSRMHLPQHQSTIDRDDEAT